MSPDDRLNPSAEDARTGSEILDLHEHELEALADMARGHATLGGEHREYWLERGRLFKGLAAWEAGRQAAWEGAGS